MKLWSWNLIFSETVITCDGFVQHLSCDKLLYCHTIIYCIIYKLVHDVMMLFFYSDSGVIHVQSATCGRTSSQICSVGRSQSETSDVHCSVFFTMGCVCTFFLNWHHRCIPICLLPYYKVGEKTVHENSVWIYCI